MKKNQTDKIKAKRKEFMKWLIEEKILIVSGIL